MPAATRRWLKAAHYHDLKCRNRFSFDYHRTTKYKLPPQMLFRRFHYAERRDYDTSLLRRGFTTELPFIADKARAPRALRGKMMGLRLCVDIDGLLISIADERGDCRLSMLDTECVAHCDKTESSDGRHTHLTRRADFLKTQVGRHDTALPNIIRFAHASLPLAFY